MCKKLIALCFVLALTSAVFADEVQISNWESGTLEKWVTNTPNATLTPAASRGVTDGSMSMKIEGPGMTWYSENAMIDLGQIAGGIDAFYAHDTFSIDISVFQNEWAVVDTSFGWTTTPAVNLLLNPGSGQSWNFGNNFSLGQPLNGDFHGTMTVNYKAQGEQIRYPLGVMKFILAFVNYGYADPATFYVDNFRLSGDPLVLSLYVDPSATGANNGSSWANAYKYLQDALTVAEPNDTIRVAQGTYRPDKDTNHPGGTNDRTATFQLKNGVAIYGGFPTGGGLWEARDTNIYETILSGDIGVPDNNNDNSYHVVTGSGTDSEAILDGFTITAGKADGSYPNNCGGGMYNYSGSPTVTNCTFSYNSANILGGGMSNNNSSSPTLTNCTFIGNLAPLGGGMYNDAPSSSPTVTNCIFIGNEAQSGGGMYNESNIPVVANCTFRGNLAAQHGGGMHNDGSSPIITNCLFNSNTAYQGGGMCSYGNSLTVTNCTFSGNSATQGGGVDNWYSSSPMLTNCILWGNTAPTGAQIYNEETSSPVVSFSDVQGGYSGTGNINQDPLFVDPVFNDYHLSHDSPCINAGDPDYVPGPNETDLEGNPRVVGRRIDMGVYEDQLSIIFVDAGATGANDGSNWADAYKYLQDALTAAEPNYDIRVAEGTYRPDMDTDNPGGTNDRTATFQLKNGVAIYGGFPAGGGAWERRNPNTYKTILSGDIGVVDDNNDNIYHVVTGSDTNSSAILDGFTITKGNANGASEYGYGGGMYNNSGSPTVINCTFSANSATSFGGGMGNYESNPTVIYCTFSANSATSFGGGMDNDNSSPTVTNCTFIANSAEDGYGGGMCNDESSTTVTNCTFTGNSAGIFGGGMFNISGSQTVTNCTFSGNSGWFGGGMSNWDSGNLTVTNCTFIGNSAEESGGGMCNWDSSSPTLANCILWGNTAAITGAQIYNDGTSSLVVSFSDVQGGWAGGNINADPLFVDADGADNIPGTADDNLRLSPDSPCIDKGNNASVPPDIADLDGDANKTEPTPLDLDLRPRFVDGDFNGTIVVDMGAYEFTCPYTSDFDGDCDVDFFDFAILANSWLQDDPLRDIAPPPAGDGIVDLEDLAVLCDNWLAGK